MKMDDTCTVTDAKRREVQYDREYVKRVRNEIDNSGFRIKTLSRQAWTLSLIELVCFFRKGEFWHMWRVSFHMTQTPGLLTHWQIYNHHYVLKCVRLWTTRISESFHLLHDITLNFLHALHHSLLRLADPENLINLSVVCVITAGQMFIWFPLTV
jgi:hypothetical protein